jgi:hypothetical protein
MKSPTGAMLNRAVNKHVEEGLEFRVSGPALILRVRYPDKAKPSDVLRAIAREAKRLGVNLMEVEFSAGNYNGEGTLKGKPLPSAYQAVGEWDAVKALAGHWAFYDYGTDHGPALPLNVRAPRGSQDKVDDFAPIPKDVPLPVAKSIRDRVRSREEREARAKRERLNRIHVSRPESPYHGERERVARGTASRLVQQLYDTSVMAPEDIASVVDVMGRYIVKHGRVPTSPDDLVRI